MSEEAFGRRVTRLGALADPVRRALYRFVVTQPGAVSRDQAAGGVDVPLHTAKHHLDRLVDEGLLVTEFRRLTGRSGPGAGRPAKLYRRSRREVAVSLPSRRYDLAGQVLADAVERALEGRPILDAVAEAAESAARVAVDAATVAAPEDAKKAAPATDLDRLVGVLEPFGYEPRVEDGLRLTNCPFDRLATDHEDLVCGMNRSFVDGVVATLGCTGLRTASGVPGEGCCVRVVDADVDASADAADVGVDAGSDAGVDAGPVAEPS
ncbi:MAG TPA: helix-turn-helix domain-containing protein [Nocardioides sp.]|jgi:predicted ArsR family transcriptional regulator